MATSQNGWSANDRSKIESRQVPGSEVKLTVRKGPAGDVLMYVASEFDRRVENIDNARGALDDWGYAERPIRGGRSLSNHASGTAIDLNATQHPLGASGTFSKSQVFEIRKILLEVGGVVRWGGNYKNRKDEMHFEIDRPYDRVAKIAATLTLEEEMTLKRGDSGRAVKAFQEALLTEASLSPGGSTKDNPLPKYGADGDYGEETEQAVRGYQKAANIHESGQIDGITAALLSRYIPVDLSAKG